MKLHIKYEPKNNSRTDCILGYLLKNFYPSFSMLFHENLSFFNGKMSYKIITVKIF